MPSRYCHSQQSCPELLMAGNNIKHLYTPGPGRTPTVYKSVFTCQSGARYYRYTSEHRFALHSHHKVRLNRTKTTATLRTKPTTQNRGVTTNSLILRDYVRPPPMSPPPPPPPPHPPCQLPTTMYLYSSYTFISSTALLLSSTNFNNHLLPSSSPLSSHFLLKTPASNNFSPTASRHHVVDLIRSAV